MPDPKTLKAGDRIRILAVPEGDAWAYDSGSVYLADTIRVLKWMIGKTFEIAWVDEYHPWVEVDIPGSDGAVEEHAIAIMGGDTTSWELVTE